MTPQQFELPVPEATPTILTSPEPLTARAKPALEKAFVAETAGELEYRSWMPDAGGHEYASWTAYLLTSRR